MESTTGFDALADRDGAIVVYPSAAQGQWNQAPAVLGSEPDDVGFLSSIVQALVANGCAAPNRVFASGISNGAGMAYRLACDATVAVAAIGTVSGDYLGGDHCSRTRAVGAIALHGTADRRVPLEGVTFGTSVHPPVELWAAGWAGRNGCAAANPETSNDSAPTARVLRWRACPNGGDVVLYEVDGGGHEWFDNASERVWAFFHDHGLSQPR
jgi:polyhydroxybutyrate depolymerase